MMRGDKLRWLTLGILLFSSLCFLAVGLIQGEAALVLDKAIRICLECIGVG